MVDCITIITHNSTATVDQSFPEYCCTWTAAWRLQQLLPILFTDTTGISGATSRLRPASETTRSSAAAPKTTRTRWSAPVHRRDFTSRRRCRPQILCAVTEGSTNYLTQYTTLVITCAGEETQATNQTTVLSTVTNPTTAIYKANRFSEAVVRELISIHSKSSKLQEIIRKDSKEIT